MVAGVPRSPGDRRQYAGLNLKGTIALSDGAGEVVALGAGVVRFKIGDRVTPTFTGSWIAGQITSADPATARGAVADGVSLSWL